MDNVEQRVTNCFALIFPGISQEELGAATAENVSGWDSVAQINLLSLIGEEFSIDVDFEEFEGATSFRTILDRVRQITARA